MCVCVCVCECVCVRVCVCMCVHAHMFELVKRLKNDKSCDKSRGYIIQKAKLDTFTGSLINNRIHSGKQYIF